MILSSSGRNESIGRAQAWLRRSTAALVVWGLAGCGAAPIEPLSVSNSALAQGLLAHWPFDEPSGTMVADSTGHGYNGVLASDNPMWVTGRFGGGLRLRIGDSVTIMNFPRQATPGWTVSVWIKLTQEDRMAFADQARAVLLSAESPSMGGWEIEFDPRPGFEWLEASYFYVGQPNDYVVLDCRCIDTDRWMQFTAVFDWTNGQLVLYRDGLPVVHTKMPAAILEGEPDLSIGRWSQGPRPIAGVIDDYAIWTRALTGDEVAALNTRAVPDPL